MRNLIVVENPRNWPFGESDTPVVSAREYLSNPQYSELRRTKVFNLCRSYRYQSLGYYVSLLALARGHTPLPSIATIQDMRSSSIARVLADELDELIQRRLRRLRTDRFVLSVYFGRNVAKGYDDLSGQLFRLFQAPLLQAKFRRDDDEWWGLESVQPVPSSAVPDEHREFVVAAAKEFFERSRLPSQRRRKTRYDMAILVDEDEANAPSNAKALQRFMAAARRRQIGVETISRDDYDRVGEFDALFIRETTAVNHHTYRFARRASAEGLVVIDDPDSIIKCTNKVYLAELLTRKGVPIPKTIIVSRDNREAAVRETHYPCIVKQPDSSFSQGVFKVDDAEELETLLDKLMDSSELLILQEFVPTEYDWRVGVLDREPLFVCKYHMVKEHWQIAQATGTCTRYGDVEAVGLFDVPKPILKSALSATRAIGDGLYGVDAKMLDGRAVIMEVNDNPNLDAGCEDAILGNALYDRIVGVFERRLERRRNGAGADV